MTNWVENSVKTKMKPLAFKLIYDTLLVKKVLGTFLGVNVVTSQDCYTIEILAMFKEKFPGRSSEIARVQARVVSNELGGV